MKNIMTFMRMVFLCLFIYFFISYCGGVLLIGEKIFTLTDYCLPTVLAGILESFFDVFMIFGFPAIAFWWMVKRVCDLKPMKIDSLHLDGAEANDTVVISERKRFASHLVEYADEATKAQNKHFIDLKKLKGFHEGSANLYEDLKRGYDLRECLKLYRDAAIEKSKKEAHKVAMMAAINVVLSPNGIGDALSMMIWNVRLVTTIIRIHGIRPSIGKIFSLYGYALFCSFMAKTAEDFSDDIEEIPFVGAIPGVKYIAQAGLAYYQIIRTSELTLSLLYNGADDSETLIKKARRNAIQCINENRGEIYGKMKEVISCRVKKLFESSEPNS